MRFMLLSGGATTNDVRVRYRLRVRCEGGTVGLLTSGITTACHPTMLTTSGGTLLLATGYDPILRMRQNERKLTWAGVPAPTTALSLSNEEDIAANPDLQIDKPDYVTKTYDYTKLGRVYAYGSYISSQQSLPNGGKSWQVNYNVTPQGKAAMAARFTDRAAVGNSPDIILNGVRTSGLAYTAWIVNDLFTGIEPAANTDPITDGMTQGTWPIVFKKMKFTLTYLNIGGLGGSGDNGSGSYSGRYQAFLRYVDKDGNVSDPSPISDDRVLDGAPYIQYYNVERPGDPRVVRRQIFRNANGSSDVFYLDIDTDDLTSSTLISYKSDAELSLQYGQPAFDDNGYNLFYLYGVPPSDKPYLAEYNSFIFAAGRRVYTHGSVSVENGSRQIQGIGTNWTPSLAGRRIVIGPSSFTILGINQTDQVITIDRDYDSPDAPYLAYAIEPFFANGNLVQWSEPGFPEAWPINSALVLPEDGDDATGLVVFANTLWVTKSRSIYAFNFTSNPGLDGDYKPVSARGLINQNCAVQVQGMCYMLDRIGIHQFKPPLTRYDYSVDSTPEHVSAPIDDLFRFDNDWLKLNFNADLCKWSAAHSYEQKVIRWHVAMNGDILPYHALCFDYLKGRRWVEEYPFPITASTSNSFSSYRPHLGGPDGQLFQPDNGNLDLVGTDNTRHSDAGYISPYTIALSGTPPANAVGSTIAIARGEGHGQWAIIVKVDGNEVEIDEPFVISQGEDSQYQIGAIPYYIVTPEYNRIKLGVRNPHYFAVEFKPSQNDLEAYVSISEDEGADRDAMVGAAWGALSSKKDDPQRMINFSSNTCIAYWNMDALKERDIPTVNTMQATIRGFSGMDRPVIKELVIAGVTTNKELST